MTLPRDLEEALAEDPAARHAFEALPPSQRRDYSHRREYLVWIEDAKKPGTRRRRITGMIARLKQPAGKH